MKVVSVAGARPQFVKVAVVSRALREAGLLEVLVHTGQHYDPGLSEVFFRELDIPYHLGIGGGTHGGNTGRMIEAIERVLLEERPDWVLVYGDTDSTLAGAIAAAKLHIPVAHVEAGLRSFNRRMPEEINRVLTDHASDLLFAPSETAVRNLLREGIDEDIVTHIPHPPHSRR
jgi:UDP-GlcNAc3NAcA epimerase